MKRHISYLVLAFVVLFSLTLASCRSDDDPEPTLIGKWKVSNITMSNDFEFETGLHEGYTFMFSDDGWYAFFEDVGTWSQDGDNITLISNDPDGIPATFRIIQPTATNLEMKYTPNGSSYIIIKMYKI